MNTESKNPENKTEQATGDIVIYTAESGETELEVKLEEETVWLNQTQMGKLFDKDVRTISEHIQNVYVEKELSKTSTIRKFRIVQTEGNRQVKRSIDFYNLDVIISVGYRVKSPRGTKFRIWANTVLKDYLVKGYAVNQKQLFEQSEKLQELQQAIRFIKENAEKPLLQDQTQELLRLINDYSESLTLLYQYDEGTMVLTKGQKPGFSLAYEDCQNLVNQLRLNIQAKGEAGSLFGQEMEHKFEGIIASIYQTFGGNDLYPSIEEKAANILYLIIKDHPFSDGNKRIGSLLFVYFLKQNDSLLKRSGERKISDTALVALALLIATSSPKEKEVMIKIITKLLKD